MIAKTSRGKVNRELIPESTVLFHKCLADHIMKHVLYNRGIRLTLGNQSSSHNACTV